MLLKWCPWGRQCLQFMGLDFEEWKIFILFIYYMPIWSRMIIILLIKTLFQEYSTISTKLIFLATLKYLQVCTNRQGEQKRRKKMHRALHTHTFDSLPENLIESWETELSVLLNLRCSGSMSKAWISLMCFVEATVSKNAVFIVRCNIGFIIMVLYIERRKDTSQVSFRSQRTLNWSLHFKWLDKLRNDRIKSDINARFEF